MNLVFKYRVTEFTELDAGLPCMPHSEYCNCLRNYHAYV